jgi:hypothetical protein
MKWFQEKFLPKHMAYFGNSRLSHKPPLKVDCLKHIISKEVGYSFQLELSMVERCGVAHWMRDTLSL